MASALRRIALRRIENVRSMSGPSAGLHGETAQKVWKNLSLYVSIPVVLIASYIIMKKELTSHPPPPEFIPYEHLRILKKNFPWGDGKRSFFHNPQRNPLPDGYEVDVHHH